MIAGSPFFYMHTIVRHPPGPSSDREPPRGKSSIFLFPRLVTAWIPSLALVASALSLPAQTPASPEQQRDRFLEWVELEKQIAAEKTDWLRQKEILLDEILLAQRELESIEEQIETARARATRADERRGDLVERRESLIRSAQVIREAIGEERDHLLDLRERLPEDLKEELRPLYRRLASLESSDRDRGIGEQVQVVVGLLSRIARFDRSVATFTTIMETEPGETREVEVIYFGLGAAFYADGEGRRGGTGRPGPHGWDWTEKNDLAPSIRRMIDVHEQQIEPAFVPSFFTLIELREESVQP